MVQTERRKSQVVQFGYQSGPQSIYQSGPQSVYQSGYQSGPQSGYQSGHQTSVTSAKKSVVYRVPIQLEWQKGKVVTETTTEYKEAATGDDSGFSDFGPSLGSFTSSSGPFQLKSETKEPESSSSSSEDEDCESESAKAKFQIESLDSHNTYRNKHGVTPLKLDKKLCSYAQEWANKLAREDSFEHRTDQDFGENLYCSWSSNPKAKCAGSKPVDSWYSEISKYTFGSEPTSSASGHFTQVVWKRTEKLGIARAKSAKSGKIIVVANYEPAGNWIGQYKDNVPPLMQGN